MAVTNLQYQITSFIGREEDLSAVGKLLAATRLVTLTGVGGCGKTRLAIEAAKAARESFPDGAWLVDLAPLREPALVPQLVAQTLGLPLAVEEPLLEGIFLFVGSKKLLLILDNCEHLIEACAELAAGILSHSADARILATSREALGIHGEAVYPLSGLACPDHSPKTAVEEKHPTNPQELLHFDAVNLFVERARACAPNFRLSAENSRAVGEVCRRLDGLPLALELASARLNVLTVEEIAALLGDRLDRRFHFLAAGPRSGFAPRQQTLRAAIDWSYSLLSRADQLLFRRLGVFTAGFTLDTAESVCADGETAAGSILDGLSSLVNKSLVVADTTGRAQARYRLLETIREYALEKLEEAGETAALRDRHLAYFLARAEEAGPRLNDTYQQLWLNWLEDNHDNIRAALAWALEHGSIEAGLRICNAIARFWEIRGFVVEGLSWFERLLQQAGDAVSPSVRAYAYSMAAFSAMFLDDAAATLAYGRAAVAAAEAAGEGGQAVLLIAMGALSSGARVSNDFDTAFEIGERMIPLLRGLPGQQLLLCMALISGGTVAIELEYYEIARAYLDEALALAQADGDPFRTGMAWNILGDLARCERKFAEAAADYERSIALLREINAQRDLASVLRNLGQTCLHLDRIERAHELFRESLTIQQAYHNMPGIAECLTGFAGLAIHQGARAAGARLLGAAQAAITRKRLTAATAWRATRMEHEYCLEQAAAGLSGPDLIKEQAAGQALTLEQAIDFALNLPVNVQPAPGHKRDMLSNREREVALLIGQGKTNGEIAAELVLSKRTVETHVNKILAKLELSHRGQIMRWAVEQER